MPHSSRRISDAAAHVSAQPNSSEAAPRVSGADGDGQRPTDPGASPAQGPEPARPGHPEEVGAGPAARATFPHSCRIVGKADYDRAFREGLSRHTPHFRALMARAPGVESRLGTVVSKKVSKRAHDRNRVKRLLREYFRARRRALSPPLDLVVVAKRGAPQLGLAAVAEELDPLISAWPHASRRLR